MFKVYSPKFDIFVYAFNIHDKPSRDIKLFCPYCAHTSECDGVSFVKTHARNNVMYKQHFRRSRSCVYNNELPHSSENESVEHLEMKYSVFKYLQSKGFDVDVEFKIGDNICDVVAFNENYKLAIECQRSGITVDEIRKRSNNYVNKGYKVIWITPSPACVKIDGIIKLNAAQRNIHSVFGEFAVYDFIHVGGLCKRTIWNVHVRRNRRGVFAIIDCINPAIDFSNDGIMSCIHSVTTPIYVRSEYSAKFVKKIIRFLKTVRGAVFPTS